MHAWVWHVDTHIRRSKCSLQESAVGPTVWVLGSQLRLEEDAGSPETRITHGDLKPLCVPIRN